VITGKVGWKGFLTWEQMREMQASGLVQFESHTVDHVMVSQVSRAAALREILDSKAELEKELERPVRFFCYPSGRYSATVEALLAGNGYLAAATTAWGTWHSSESLMELSRVRIHGAGTLAGFAGYLGVPLNTP
jgi:peptidoglycan/xylan/chitin deacetylase (PgdA/CDA1 family)